MYEFSVPMPYTKELIDDIELINHKINKSKITCLYFALHTDCPDNPGFGQSRTFHSINDLDYWMNLIEYSFQKGFDFVYLLNSPKSFFSETKFFDIQLEKLDKLLTKLQNVGCNKLRISNTQLLGYLKKHYPYFKLYASTSFEYCQLKQYNIFFEMFPEIVEIVPSFDCNKNFKLIKNLKNSHPNIDIELMVNEGCLSGCPLRTHHNISIPFISTNTLCAREGDLTSQYFTTLCDFYTENHTFYSLCNPNLIYPWEINEYSKIGINKFKLVGRNSPTFIKTGNKNSYEVYLKGVDNYSLIENEPYGYLNNYYFNLKTKIKDIRPYLPKLKHFIKNGHLCSSICNSECKYCFECAKKMEKNIKIVY